MRLLSLFSSLILAGCSVVGIRSGTEEPAHTIRATIGAVELRDYAPRIAAQIAVAGEEEEVRSIGFRKLAGYIFGGNNNRASIAMTAPVAQSSQSIAMTAPVAQQRDAQGRWLIRFFMPAGSSLATLPAPNDPDISLIEIQAETYAVLRFTGDRGPDAVAAQGKVLLAGIAGTPWSPQGSVEAWFYDPPWTLPPLRRNEVAVRVTLKAGSASEDAARP